MALKSNEDIWPTYAARHKQQQKEVEENTKQGNRVIKMWEHKGWGDSISFWDYDTRKITGHLTPLPKVGDELQCKMVSGGIGRFEIISVRYCGDPSDMFFGVVKDVEYIKG